MNRQFIRKLAGETAMKRIDAFRHELRYGPPAVWDRWKNSRERKRKSGLLVAWFDGIHSDPPDVLIGANVGRLNGVRNHMLGIRDHSSLEIQLSPPDEILEEISYHDLHTTFRHEVMNFNPQGVGVIHSNVYPYYIQWCLKHRDSGPLWVHTYHLPYFRLDAGPPLEPWQLEINNALIEDARHAHVRISVSKWQQRYLESEHGITSTYVPNGVDVQFCDRADPERFREKIGRDPFVLYVGRDEPVKNPDEFISVAAQIPEYRFVMLGRGLDESSLRLSGRKNIPANLVMLGEASRIEVQDALAACSVLVVTSKREGLPTLVLEAMAHNRAIVVPDEPGCREAIDDGAFGSIYRPGDIDDCVAKTRESLRLVDRQRGSREKILSEFDWRVVGPKLDSIYRGTAA